MIMDRVTAETVALQAMAYLLEEDHLRDRFLNFTGMTGDILKAQLGETDFLASLLSFFVDHEPDLIALANTLAVPPELVVKAWHVLGGSVGRDF